jgi:UrcA family protein
MTLCNADRTNGWQHRRREMRAYAFGRMLVTAALLVGVPLLAPVMAADQPATPVSLRGIDFDDPAGLAEMERRIDRAAVKLCGVDAGADPAARHQQNLCVIATGNAGRAQLQKRLSARRDAAGAQAPTRMAGL